MQKVEAWHARFREQQDQRHGEDTVRGGSRWEREVKRRSWKGFSPGPMILSWFPGCWEEMRWKARVGNKTGREARGTVRIQTLLHVLLRPKEICSFSLQMHHFMKVYWGTSSTRMETRNSARSTGLFLSPLISQREAAIFHKVRQVLRLCLVAPPVPYPNLSLLQVGSNQLPLIKKSHRCLPLTSHWPEFSHIIIPRGEREARKYGHQLCGCLPLGSVS